MDSLAVGSGLQFTLLVFLILRGSKKGIDMISQFQFLDALLTAHTVFANTIVTSVWITWTSGHNDHKGPEFGRMTAAVVLSNMFTGLVFTTLFIRSGAAALAASSSRVSADNMTVRNAVN